MKASAFVCEKSEIHMEATFSSDLAPNKLTVEKRIVHIQTDEEPPHPILLRLSPNPNSLKFGLRENTPLSTVPSWTAAASDS